MNAAERTERRRLFLALWPDEAVRAALAAALAGPGGQGRQRWPGDRARPVRCDNLHVTLAFLGSLDRRRQACIEQAMESVRVPPCELVLDRLGHWRRAQILWLGSAGTPAPLYDLVAQIRGIQQRCGLEAESRPWQVHMTLARRLRHPPEDMTWLRPVRWPLTEFVLLETLPHPDGGVRYVPRRRWGLTGTTQAPG